MALTKEQRQEILDVIARTSRRRSGEAPQYAKEFHDFLDLCEQEEIVRIVDGYPYKIYVMKSKNREKNCPVHINIHGGGFIGHHAENDSMFSAYVADGIQGIVADIDYTTSDAAPFPVALNQCYDAAQFVITQCPDWDADASRVSMGGYSAGGSLTAGVALKAAESKEFRLCLQVMGYPALDNIIHPLYKKDGYQRVLPAEREVAFSQLYLDGDEEAASSPYASPVYAPDELLEKLPRTLMCSASGCNFRHENEEYARRLASVGVLVTVKRFPKTGHGFIPHFADGWKEATDLIIRTIRSS